MWWWVKKEIWQSVKEIKQNTFSGLGFITNAQFIYLFIKWRHLLKRFWYQTGKHNWEAIGTHKVIMFWTSLREGRYIRVKKKTLKYIEDGSNERNQQIEDSLCTGFISAWYSSSCRTIMIVLQSGVQCWANVWFNQGI